MDPNEGVNILQRLAGVYGDVVVATLVMAVVVLFVLLLRSKQEQLNDARAFATVSVQLKDTLDTNTKTIQGSVAVLDEASDTLRVAYELMGKRPRRRGPGGGPGSSSGTPPGTPPAPEAA